MPEHAWVEACERRDLLACERDHHQAGRAEHVPGGVAGVERERGLPVGSGLDEAAAPRPCGDDRVEAGGLIADTAGTVYFRRKSSFNCGEDTKLVARQIDGTESLLYTSQSTSDFFGTVAVDNADGTTDVYFDRGSCEDFTDFSDIWKLSGV